MLPIFCLLFTFIAWKLGHSFNVCFHYKFSNTNLRYKWNFHLEILSSYYRLPISEIESNEKIFWKNAFKNRILNHNLWFYLLHYLNLIFIILILILIICWTINDLVKICMNSYFVPISNLWFTIDILTIVFFTNDILTIYKKLLILVNCKNRKKIKRRYRDLSRNLFI